MNEIFNCFICSKTLPIEVKHVHHKNPRSADGSNDASNLVDLCHPDHNNIHMLAIMLGNVKKAGTINDLAVTLWPDNPSAQIKAIELAIAIYQGAVLKKDGQLSPEKSPLSFDLPTEYKEVLKQLAKDHKMGVSNYIRKIILSHIANKHPLLREKILKLLI